MSGFDSGIGGLMDKLDPSVIEGQIIQPTYEFIPPNPRAREEGLGDRGTGRTTAQLQYALALLYAGHHVVYLSENHTAATHNLMMAIDMALKDFPAQIVTDTGAARSSRRLSFNPHGGPYLFFHTVQGRPSHTMAGLKCALIKDHWLYDAPWPRNREGRERPPQGWCMDWFEPHYTHRHDPSVIEPAITAPILGEINRGG